MSAVDPPLLGVILSRLDDLERRLGVLERSSASPPLPAELIDETRAQYAPAPEQPPPLPFPAPSPVPVVPLSKLDRLRAARPFPTAPATAVSPSRDLESRIGQNWTSLVGALVVVLAVFFFLKYAWDEGWLHLPPTGRVIAALIASAALIIAGQWTHRRRMGALAATLSGAGVAVAMAACFAAKALFDPPVFSTPAAFVGVAIAAALGILLALRLDSLAVALVSLIGAYVAPLILRTGADRSAALMAYLAALAAVGWTLTYFRPSWPALRWFTWCASAAWVALWMTAYGTQPAHRALAVGAITFFFAGTLVELLASLRRARAGAADSAALDGALSVLSLVNTAAAFVGLYVVLDPLAPARGTWLSAHPAAGVALVLAVLHAAVASVTRGSHVATSSLLQAAALVTLAIPLALNQLAITLAWLLLATVLAALCLITRYRPIRVWSLVLLGLTLGRLLAFDAFDADLTATWLTIAGLPVSRWLMLAWAIAGMFHAIAWLLAAPVSVVPAGFTPLINGADDVAPPQRDAPPPALASSTATTTAAVGTALLIGATACYWSGHALTLFATLWAALILALHVPGRRLNYLAHAGVLLMVAGIKWMFADNLTPLIDDWRPRPGSDAAPLAPILNASALAGVALIALTAWLAVAARNRLGAVVAGRSWAAPLVLLFALLNFETLRAMDSAAGSFADPGTAKQVALSALWAIVGLIAVVAGFARQSTALRYAALALLGVTLAKILLIDLSQVRPVYRILSFLAVGLMLLGVSYVYHRQAAASERR
ncbi:MAG TPA: DUF2339 domain-containing protein [Tepidisphaeraceae bacterium]|nr:DUF2339 domain-containing protein [Tepidisphaeraceae bacterium]